MKRRNRNDAFLVALVLAAGAAHGAAGCAHAADAAASYPSKPIRFIVPNPPSGPVDTIARIVGQKLSATLGQPVIVDNRPGANGIIGMQLAAKAAPDGYTLIMSHIGTLALNQNFYGTLPYDPVKDFAPVIMVAVAPQILVANPSLPVRSVRELIQLAKSKPGQLTYGSLTGAHLSMELFKSMAAIDIMQVPYRGAASALLDLLGGRISLVLRVRNIMKRVMRCHDFCLGREAARSQYREY